MLRNIVPVTGLMLSTFFLLAGSGLTGITLPLRAGLEGWSPVIIGWIGFGYALCFTAGCVIVPRMVRRVGHVRVYAVLATLLAMSLLFHALIVHPLAWIAFRGVAGFALAGAYMVVESWLNEKATNESRGQIFSFYMIMNMVGMMAGQFMVLLGDPATTTLFIIASKTFTTLETLTNARMARDWFLAALKGKGIETDGAIAKHFVAVSTALDKVAEFGIDPANAFGFWNWVGGRYSVDSAVGTVLAVAIGPENFADFLSGFRTVDEHFATKAPAENVPMLMGLLNVWYVNFFKAGSHAVLPYAQYLHRFPAYLQQLTMESNGKSVRWDGSPVTTETGEVFWGEPGTNGQHAFYQLIHQGTQLIPADFIAVANPAHPVKDGGVDVHELFLSNYLAQTAALAFGKTAEEVRAEGTPEEIVPARVFTGNKPTTSILAPALTPAVVGELIALYEHITFTQGIVWGIDSFDQWGVELGKKLALEIAPAVQGDEAALKNQDASTRGLITCYRGLRK